MAAKQLTLPGDIVKKSNVLARARWSAKSVLEPRLVALLASKINVTDTDFKVYEIHVSELLGKTYGGRDFEEVETAVDNVMKRVITFYNPKGWTKVNIFTDCSFVTAEGMLVLSFNPKLKPHYLQLKKNFAQYNLLEFMTLPSVYSQRIFEFLKSWDDKPEVTISLAELNEMLDTPASLRADFAGFRRRVLEKAHKDIHAKSTLTYEWEPIKSGKAVSAIRFIFAAGAKATGKKEKQKKAEPKHEKKSAANNALFLAAVECFKSGVCNYEKGKEKCKVCRKVIQKT